MVKLQGVMGKQRFDVYVNPSQVRHMFQSNTGIVKVLFAKEHAIFVVGTLDEVAQSLNGI